MQRIYEETLHEVREHIKGEDGVENSSVCFPHFCDKMSGKCNLCSMDVFGFQFEDSAHSSGKVWWQGPETADHMVSGGRAEEGIAGSDLAFSSNSAQDPSMEGNGSSYLS